MRRLLIALLLLLASSARADNPVILLSAPELLPGQGWTEPVERVPFEQPLPLFFRTARSDFMVATEGPPPDLTGLRELPLSGSGQFSPVQWPRVLQALRQTGARHVTVLDLRQEPHVMVNGDLCLTWMKPFNSAGWGRNAAEIDADEALRVRELPGTMVTARGYAVGVQEDPSRATGSYPIRVVGASTERAVVEGSGCSYVRLYAPDDMFPPADQVDRFVRFVRDLPADEWVHIHCAAGHSRTTAFMVMFDVLRNGDRVSLQDIVARHGLLGTDDLDHPDRSDPVTQSWALETRDRLRLFYEYRREQGPGYQVPWSRWLQARRDH